MAVELRWVVPAGTTTERPRLQYRNWGEWPAAAGLWTNVPTVVEETAPPKPAPTALIAAAGQKSDCEFPICAVHHICERKCSRNAGVNAGSDGQQAAEKLRRDTFEHGHCPSCHALHPQHHSNCTAGVTGTSTTEEKKHG